MQIVTERMREMEEEDIAHLKKCINNIMEIARRMEMRMKAWDLDLPIFRGEDPYRWIIKVQGIFLKNWTPVEEQLELATVCLAGEAQDWFQSVKSDLPAMSWSNFTAALIERFLQKNTDEKETLMEGKQSVVQTQEAEVEEEMNRMDWAIENEKEEEFTRSLVHCQMEKENRGPSQIPFSVLQPQEEVTEVEENIGVMDRAMEGGVWAKELNCEGPKPLGLGEYNGSGTNPTRMPAPYLQLLNLSCLPQNEAANPWPVSTIPLCLPRQWSLPLLQLVGNVRAQIWWALELRRRGSNQTGRPLLGRSSRCRPEPWPDEERTTGGNLTEMEEEFSSALEAAEFLDRSPRCRPPPWPDVGKGIEEILATLHLKCPALKVLILDRMGKSDEALSVCLNAKERLCTNDSILIDDLTLSTLQIVFQRLDHLDVATSCYDHACGKFPNNLELMMGLFNYYVREYSFVKQQQTSIKMYKIVGEERFLLWAVCSIQLQVCCDDGLLLSVEGLLKKHIVSHSLHEPEALIVYISVLEQQSKFGDALVVLSGKLGSRIMIEIDRLRIQRRLLARAGAYTAAADIFQKVLELCPYNWECFLYYLGCLLEDDRNWYRNANYDSIYRPKTMNYKHLQLTEEVFDSHVSDASVFGQKLQTQASNDSIRCPHLENLEIEGRKLLFGRGEADKLLEALMQYFFRILIDAKGQFNDITGMDKFVETRKSEGVEPDIRTQAILAQHYVHGGFCGQTDEHFEELKILLGADHYRQCSAQKSLFYQAEQWYLSFDDDRTIDIEACSKCHQLRQVYNCSSRELPKEHHTTQLNCGCYINECDYKETFCLELLGLDCWKQLLNCQERQGSGCVVLHQQAIWQELCSKILNSDPWGQGSFEGKSIVMTTEDKGRDGTTPFGLCRMLIDAISFFLISFAIKLGS